MIYLIRHGETDWNVERKIQGQTDIPLNKNGQKQAKDASEEISKLKIDKIYSSDLSRAKETAEIINKKVGAKITFDKRLREQNFGKYEGCLKEDITEKQWDILNYEPEKVNGESRKQLYERVKGFISKLKDEGNTLIVTHAVLLCMILYYAQNKEGFDMNKYNEFIKNLLISNAKVVEYKKK